MDRTLRTETVLKNKRLNWAATAGWSQGLSQLRNVGRQESADLLSSPWQTEQLISQLRPPHSGPAGLSLSRWSLGLWENWSNQFSQQCSSVAFILVPASRYLLCLLQGVVTWLESQDEIIYSSPSWFWSWCFIKRIEALTKAHIVTYSFTLLYSQMLTCDSVSYTFTTMLHASIYSHTWMLTCLHAHTAHTVC